MAQDAVRGLRRDIRASVHSYPEAKAKAKEATNSDAWGPSDEQKMELVALATAHHENRNFIYKAVWKRVHDDTPYWMHVHKGLSVLEYFIIFDVPEIHAQLAEHAARLTHLSVSYANATHVDPVKARDLNAGVQRKAARLLELMASPELVAEEATRMKMAALRMKGGSVGSVSPGGTAPAAAAAGSRQASQPPSHPPSQPPSRSVSPATTATEIASPDAQAAAPAGAPRPDASSPPSARSHMESTTSLFDSPAARSPPPAPAALANKAQPPPAATARPPPAAANPAFDPFAEFPADKPPSQQPSARSGSRGANGPSLSDIFDTPAYSAGTPPPPAAAVEAQPARSANLCFVPEPAKPRGSSSTSPAPARTPTTDDAAMMQQQLDAYEGKVQRPSAGRETLHDIMTRRGSGQ